MPQQAFIGCPDCDLLHRRSTLPHRGVAVCSRCGAMLYRANDGSLDHTLALALGGIVFYVIANLFPFLSLSLEGRVQETVLLSGVIELYHQGMRMVSILVLCTGIIFPGFVLAGLAYLLVPLKFGFKIRGFAAIFRMVLKFRPWAMMEVFLLGILVAMVKLVKMAEITPGLGLYAFLVLVFILTAMMATLHPENIWDRL